MSNLSVSNIFNVGDVIDATKFNTNYTTDIAGYINNRNSGASSWDRFLASSATTVPLVVNNSTGTQDIVNFKDNSVTRFQVLDGGYVSMDKQTFVHGFKNGDYEITSTTPTALQSWDISSSSGDANTNGKFTAPAGGKYFMSVFLNWTAPLGAAAFYAYIYKNGASLISAFSQASLFTIVPNCLEFSDLFILNSGDYLEIYVADAGGGGIKSTISSLDTSCFSVMKLS